jgi:glycosyltransferase involved in cell wall biosynthesis
MERAIQVAAGPEGMEVLKSVAQRYVASTTPVKKNLVKNHGIEPSQIELLPNFIVIDELLVQSAEQYRARMRQQLGIPQDAIVIGGCGGTDERKGIDLFVEMARSVRDRMSDGVVHFVWVGQVFDDTFTHSVIERVREWKLEKVFHFTGAHPKPPELFCGFDVFVLSSREEPMGLVALEAASVGKPIVCFAGAGGMADFVADECGIVVEPVAGEPLARAVLQMASDPGMMSSFGSRAYCKVRATHDIELVAPRFAKLIQEMAGCREQAHDTGGRVNCLIGV